MTTLLVDVANVVGSRPDGWWRDRAGATTRLLAGLAPLVGTTVPGPDGVPLPVTALLAVLEGRARDVEVPPVVTAVRSPGSGDDALVQAVAGLEDVLVVTADRGLRARLPAGVRVGGPGWLRGLCDSEHKTMG
ncbi:hypothetical protein GB931_01720 [Modestobacter sp. I12A-02628]|uniref:NTP pyrophosphohydrolase n=1 Tax=Goekera deserti TaxID=2497753 RepID=A0A7K3WIE8_9ACTN|nr:hypothetical protein [Goekera deserti]MPQ96656.1 hypothetical protein [Goekera deserti]NDI47032.1 hypothetical protein [Goekera deserti]NEL56268.1 hypothetical protein [Goekera deserti]